MDEQVLRSLIKWPNVPDCYGWLGLDRRGQWRMRDEFAQQNHLSGQVIKHSALNDYVSRNYARDIQGRFFFQNGPQRVFINLDATPWIARFLPSKDGVKIITQCASEIKPSQALSDERGNIYIVGLIHQVSYQDSKTNQVIEGDHQGIALLHDHDLDYFSELATIQEQACSFGGSWSWQGKQLPLDPIHSQEIDKKFSFTKHPKPSTI
jgi:Protein of unknown function (DUF2946)